MVMKSEEVQGAGVELWRKGWSLNRRKVLERKIRHG